MLDIRKKQSDNYVEIEGILKELDIQKRTTGDGRDFIMGKAIIGVDEEINGVVIESDETVNMFSMRLKKDGTENGNYKSIANMENQFTSLAAADEPSMASKVLVRGARLEENAWVDQSGQVHNTWRVSSNFMSKKNGQLQSHASFELTGVIGKDFIEEIVNDEPTGRLIVNLVVVGYQGKADVLTMYVETELGKNYIQENWNKGDTVKVAGYIVATQQVETYKEEMGFGEDIIRTRTKPRKELILTRGIKLDDDSSYDTDDVGVILKERQARLEELKNKPKSTPKKPSSNLTDFGF